MIYNSLPDNPMVQHLLQINVIIHSFLSNSFDVIFTVLDQFYKFVVLTACKTSLAVVYLA